MCCDFSITLTQPKSDRTTQFGIPHKYLTRPRNTSTNVSTVGKEKGRRRAGDQMADNPNQPFWKILSTWFSRKVETMGRDGMVIECFMKLALWVIARCSAVAMRQHSQSPVTGFLQMFCVFKSACSCEGSFAACIPLCPCS